MPTSLPLPRKVLYFAIITLGFLLLLVILEYSFRVIRPELRYYIHIPYSVKKNLGYTGGHPFSYNKWHLREIDFDLQKPKDQLRILCLGDSITFGYGLSYEDTWPKKLQAKLTQYFPERPIFCINAGGVGTNTHSQLKFYQELGWQFDPDIVVVGFCLNDIEPKDIATVTTVSTGAKLKKFMEFRFHLRSSYFFTALDLTLTEAYRLLWSQFTHKNPLEIGSYRFNCFGLTPEADQAWQDTLTAIAALQQACIEKDAVLAIAAFPYQFMISDDPRDNPYNLDRSSFKINPLNKLGDFCKKHNLIFIDLLEDFRTARKKMLQGQAAWDPLFFDYCHPTPLGQEVATEAIMKKIAPSIHPIWLESGGKRR